ncbi:kelch-like ECH-associated protein 1, partial [Malurus melanocephalus]|uniref:kelch-like ECH-associated protein 1 n=1 Tax=Malurus melanocephalus TaxID=175006 RepID=UPI002547F6B5
SHGCTHHCSVERYEPERDEWALVAPMGTRRIGVGVAVYEPERDEWALVAPMGTRRIGIRTRTYEPERDEWALVAPMGTRRIGVGVAVSLLCGCSGVFLGYL